MDVSLLEPLEIKRVTDAGFELKLSEREHGFEVTVFRAGRYAGRAIFSDYGDGSLILDNSMVPDEHQRRGIGKAMVLFAAKHSKCQAVRPGSRPVDPAAAYLLLSSARMLERYGIDGSSLARSGQFYLDAVGAGPMNATAGPKNS